MNLPAIVLYIDVDKNGEFSNQELGFVYLLKQFITSYNKGD